jgi:RNA 2',3'-cyclic 3'-phosphodiesterase
MSESIRSFLAFDIENEVVTNRLLTAQNLLVQTGVDLKIVAPKNIHLTIRFLGDVSPPLVAKIFEIMKNVQFSAFEVRISGIGAFPDLRYPRVIWAGITSGADHLKKIFNQLEPQLQGVGFTPDPKGFSPHLTIARVRSGKNRQQLGVFLSNNSNYDFGIVKARCLRLKRSILTPRGPIYSTLKEFCSPP